MAGLIHIYCGDGKGKTTAATGLAVRSAGAGNRVFFAQFFKNGSSSEVKALKQLPTVETFHCITVPGRYKNMTEEQQAQARADYSTFLHKVWNAAEQQEGGLLVLDEAVSACNHGIIEEQQLLDWLKHKPENLEVVLTGRNPSAALLETADYVSEIHKVKHPFDRGIAARRGIEY